VRLLKDKYGLSWQIVPVILRSMLQDNDAGTTAGHGTLLKMKKLDIKS